MSVGELYRRKELVPPGVDGPLHECPLNSSGTRNAAATVICFKKHTVKFLKTLLASGFQKYFIVFTNRLQGQNATLAQDRNTSASADISIKAVGKVLRKYNKVHGSINSLKCSTNIQNVQLEHLNTRCLCELMAFHINQMERKNKTTIPGLLDDCRLQITEGRSSISASLSNSKMLAVDLTCSICLETLFDPVALTCSHMFCYMCACSAGSVSTIDGIKAADPKSACPLCRKKGVFRGAVRMPQLSILLRRKYPEYWEERRQQERQARLKEAKEYWQLQCRTFVGIN